VPTNGDISNIKNPGIMSCILIKCTYDKNLEMIQPLVQELALIGVFGFGPLESDRTEIWSVSYGQ
jgi:hypothetical protein